jgi:hypothetical protein
MSVPWKAGDEVYKTMQTLIASNANLAPLALVDDEILVVFKEKASKSGDQVVVGTTAKANALLSVVGEQDYKFVITLAGDEWQDMGNKEREALLFHHLCACGIEENPDTGDMKCFVKRPDVSFFREEVEVFGFWRTSGSVPEPNYIDELFGIPPQPAPPVAAPQTAPATPTPVTP